jgi:hypothetical protein
MMERKLRERMAPRRPIEAVIKCRPYASNGATCASDGFMLNYSRRGAYIETSREYKSGTILILRTVHQPSMSSSMTHGDWPPSICLAEIKWRQELTEDNAVCYGMGLRYLD